MIIAFILLAVLLIAFAKNKPASPISILNKPTTKSIEGYLAVYIIFSHMRQYVPYDGFGAGWLDAIINVAGQACVAPFFFFSGFGIIESIKKKGEAYSRTILVNRFLRIWIWFLIALIPYYLLDLLWLHKYTAFDYALAPFGLISIGNSNWFVAIILLTYLLVGIAFLVFRKKTAKAVFATSIALVVFVVIAIALKIPSWWYDSVLCFPLGLICSLFKDKIEVVFTNSTFRVFILLYSIIFIIISFLIPKYVFDRGIVVHLIIRCTLACIIILIFSSRFIIKHPIFEYLGTCSFAIFIFQRIPMIVFNELSLFSNHYMYWLICIAFGILLGCVFQKLFKCVDSLFIDKWYRRLSTKYTSDNNADVDLTTNAQKKDLSLSDKINIRGGIIINYLSFFVSILGLFLVTNRILFLVGDKEYGLYSFVLSITSWLTVITAALNSSFIRFSVKQEQNEGIPDRTNTIYMKLFSILSIGALAIGTITICVLYCFRVSLQNYSWEDSAYIYQLLFLSLINLCITIPGTFFSLFISFRKNFIFANSLALMVSILNLVAQFLLAYYTHRIIGVAVYTIVSSLCVCVVSYWYCRKKLSLSFMKTKLIENKTLLRAIAAFSAIVVFNAVVDQINSQVDKTILGALGIPAAVTIYQLGHSFAVHLTSVSVAVSGPFAPSINECAAKGDNKGIDEIYLKVSRFQTIVIVMVAFGFLACGKEMVLLWLGDGYERVYYIGSALMLLNICPLTINISIEIQRARNKHFFRAIVYFIIAVLNVLASLLFIWLLPEGYEVYGCLLGTILATICSHWVLMNWYNYKEMHLPVGKYLLFLAKHIIFGLASYFIAYFLGTLVVFQNQVVFAFLMKGGVFVLIYATGVLLTDKSVLSPYIKNV